MKVTDDIQERCDELARMILAACKRRGLYLACAESLTAGLLSDAFVRIPGASEVFLGSAVTYDSAAKSSVLGVEKSVIDAHGVVYPVVAEQMALGATSLYAQPSTAGKIVGLATTGVAGPGPDHGHPAGLVYIGLAVPQYVSTGKESAVGYSTYSYQLHLQGTREAVRRSTVLQLLRRLFQFVNA